MVSFEKLLSLFKGDARQFLVLTGHFFNRFFQNDLVAFEEQMKQRLIAVLALLAVLGGHISNSILFKYFFVPDNGVSWQEKGFFISFFMIVLGFVTALEWDVIFPDARDYANLISLPVKIRTFFSSKYASFLLFIALFSAGVNLMATFVFPYYLSRYRSLSVVFMLRFGLVHFFSCFLANLFMFFFCVFLQGILMAALSQSLFKKVSLIFRFILLVAFVFLMFFHLSGSVSGLPDEISSFEELKENNSPFIYAYPPMWFVGIYEKLLGNQDPFFHALANLALLAIVFTLAAFFVTLEVSYRKQIKRAQEVKTKPVHALKLREFFSGVFSAIFLRNPVQKAVFSFFGKTFSRSSQHKMRLASYLAVAVALILVLLASGGTKTAKFPVSCKNILAIPLILSFFLLVGIRTLVNIPSSSEANWIFKMTEVEAKKHYFSGFKKAIFFFALLPLFFMLFVFYLFLWGWQNALLHCLFGLALSTLLLELLFFKYPKIPFACTYLPGKGKIHILWIFYVFAFLGYVSLMALIESSFFQRPSNFYYFYGALLFVLLAIKIVNDYFLYRKLELVYEEEPEPVMVTLSQYT